MIYQLELAGHPLRYSLHWPKTHFCFGEYMRPVSGEAYDLRASDGLLAHVRTLLPPDAKDHYVEYRTLILSTSHPLLRYGCCLFHAAAFLYQGRAWLVTGPTGVGKTTQFRNWQRLFPGEIQMICGDMPVLEGREDGSVWVHPSPWNGKEHMGNRSLSAPLGGVVRLEQKDENFIYPLPLCDAIPALFRQFMVRPEDEAEILALSELVERALKYAPVWFFENRGDDASTVLLRDTLLKGGLHDTL
ncbi:MAG: hypothetical protein II458_09085 [Oscillospiraceae bacterium]|nr:hypothetical protein [Oscillospiraceae bacterium]